MIPVLVNFLFEENLPSDSSGLQPALEMSWSRHQGLMPTNRYTIEQMKQHIRDINTEGRSIPYLLERMEDSLTTSNWAEVLRISNWIYAYSQLGAVCNLGGLALSTSLNVHRKIIKHINGLGEIEEYLNEFGSRLSPIKRFFFHPAKFAVFLLQKNLETVTTFRNFYN